MRIAPVANFYAPINFTSKVVKVGMGRVPQNIKDMVDDFEETDKKNATELGSGDHAVAYLFNKTNCVIKASKEGKSRVVNGDFSNEAKSLTMVPDDFEHTQKLIGNVQTEDGNWYLLSTFVEGKTPDGETVKWDRESLHSLMDSLAKLDAARVYHGDVSRRNCLVTDDKQVNLIDFQYAEKFKFDTDADHKFNAARYKVPYFIAPSNLQMFEESDFGTYLCELDEKAKKEGRIPNEARLLYRDYLIEKSYYHQKRAEAFEKQGARPEIVEYEKLMAKYLQDPTDEIISLESKKLHILTAHRKITSTFDEKYNIMSLIPYYLEAISKSRELSLTADELSKQTNDKEYAKLLSYIQKDAEFWRATMTNEVDGRHGNESAFQWILRNTMGCPLNKDDDIHSKFIKTSELPHEKNMDINGIASGDPEVFAFDNYREDDFSKSIKNEMAKMRHSESYTVSKDSESYALISDFHKSKQEIMDNLRKACRHYMVGDTFDSIFYSLNALHKTTAVRLRAFELLNDPRLSQEEQDKIGKDAAFFFKYTVDLSEMNEALYDSLLKRALKKDQNQ